MSAVCVRLGVMGVAFACASALQAAVQVWNDAGPDNVWSTNALNWDAGAAWTNDNSALFSGGSGTVAGETIDVAAAVTVGNITFQTNGYVIADANGDGTLTLVGGGNQIAVPVAGSTANIHEVLAGNGFTKTGPGLLQLRGANSYTGVTTVSAGTLRLNTNAVSALGASGANNHTVIEDGATLDVFSAFNANVNEDIFVKGRGVNNAGAFVNNGPSPYYNVGFRNLTLTGDASIGGAMRFDFSGNGTYTGNGYTLTKVGAGETAVGRAVDNSPIIIDGGVYTVQHASALGSTDYPTTLNAAGKLQAWGSYTIAERLIVNGGTISSSGTGINTLRLVGNITLNSNVVVQTDASNTNTLELAGVMDGAGGFTRAGNGFVVVTNDNNSYTGPTIINGGSSLWVSRTLGGTGKLGSGAVTNNGTLYANSPRLGGGTVVNNASGTLYLNPAQLDTGRIINFGTVNATSALQTASSVVNGSGGTWNSYSGVFGSGALTNSGTLNLYTNFITYGQFANNGTLNIRTTMALPDPITFLAGSVSVLDLSNTLSVAGPITVNTSAAFGGTASSVTEVSGAISGPGGVIRSGDGLCYLTSDANSYAGPTVINDSKRLFVGKAGLAPTGRLGSGAITNYGTLFIDHAGAYENANGINGYGSTFIRYGANVTLSGKVSTNNVIRIAHGALSITNGAVLCVPADFTLADRQSVYYSVFPTNCLLVTNITATVTVSDGSVFSAISMTFGNGPDVAGGIMTGILNQVGGTVRTTGVTAEENGVRLGHYPMARCFYNMMGGTLTVAAPYELGCATDGQGWFKQTGGEVTVKRVMLNERDNTGGYGRLTVAGGTMNLGSLIGSTLSVSNGIAADRTAPYLVEFGGQGGLLRAVTNIEISVSNALFGAGSSAVTFDTRQWRVSMTNVVSGQGGFNKSGSGTLSLSGNNTFTGAVWVAEGALALNSAAAATNAPVTVGAGAALDLGGFAQNVRSLAGSGVVSNGTLTVAGAIEPGTNGIGTLTLALANAAPGGNLVVDVADDGTCDVLHANGALSVSGMTLQLVDSGKLNTRKAYVIAESDGALSGRFSSVTLPSPWYVYYNDASRKVTLAAAVGTLIRLQ